MSKKLVYLDFEFTGISEPKLDLVSVAAICMESGYLKYQREFWLYRNPNKQRQAAKFFRRLIEEGYTFVSYVIEAEVRGLMALFGEDDSWMQEFKAIDLYLEYRCLLNHNHKLAYGEQYLNGKVIVTTPPLNKFEAKRMRDGDEEEAHNKPSYSLASACFKLLGKKIDTEEKEQVREIIIRGTPAQIEANIERIQRYNKSDIDLLPRLLSAIVVEFLVCLGVNSQATMEVKEALDEWRKGAFLRGDYALRTARMVREGYPVNVERLGYFKANISQILISSIEHCLETAPEVQAFRKSKKNGQYSLHEQTIRTWLEAQNLPGWRRTDGGKRGKPKLSLSKDAFGDFFDSDSQGFGGAFCRYLKTKQSLNGFVPSKTSKKGVFDDFIGKDGRVRPFFGIYGSQASRSQPGSIGFIPLKAHWMRVFIEARPGFALVQGDFASQEFLIAAILSQDEEMINAYKSGDVYLAFGKSAGLIPLDGTKESHPKQRNGCKTMVLGVSYDLSAKGLAPRLSQATKEAWTEAGAQKLIDLFYDTYPKYAEWKDEIKNEYRDSGFAQLSDNWVMWGDNDNERSVGNFPVQGEGAVIMRRAVKLAQDRGLRVLYTVHDSLTIEYPSNELGQIRQLQDCMIDAFDDVMSPHGITTPVRIDLEAWSVDYAPLPALQGVKFSSEHVTPKGAQDLEKYRKYLLAKS